MDSVVYVYVYVFVYAGLIERMRKFIGKLVFLYADQLISRIDFFFFFRKDVYM